MSKKIISGVMLTMLLVGMLTLTFNIQPVKSEPKTWTVDDDGPADFNTIQEAINAANDGDTIQVAGGIYYENVVVNKNVSLIGRSRDNTVINGIKNDITIQGKNVCVSISGFTIRNGRTGILLWETSGSNINDNTIINNNWYGIILRESNNTILNGNIVANNTNAVGLWNSFNNILGGNTIANNVGKGIEIQRGDGNTLGDNNLINNTYHWDF